MSGILCVLRVLRIVFSLHCVSISVCLSISVYLSISLPLPSIAAFHGIWVYSTPLRRFPSLLCCIVYSTTASTHFLWHGKVPGYATTHTSSPSLVRHRINGTSATTTMSGPSKVKSLYPKNTSTHYLFFVSILSRCVSSTCCPHPSTPYLHLSIPKGKVPPHYGYKQLLTPKVPKSPSLSLFPSHPQSPTHSSPITPQ